MGFSSFAAQLAAELIACCTVCGQPGSSFCEKCWGRVLPVPASPAGLTGMIALGAFSGPLRQAIHAWKFRGRTMLATVLGERLADQLWALSLVHPEARSQGAEGEKGPGGAGTVRVCREGSLFQPEAVVPIPGNSLHRRRRGFDHTSLLAKAVGCRLGLPVREILVHRGPFVGQSGTRSRAERELPPFSFLVKGPCTRLPERAFLLDDVVTTGETMRSALVVLRSVGVVSFPLALAVTPLRFE